MRELDDLRLVRVDARHVLQARREPDRAVRHRFPDQRLHPRQFRSRRQAISGAHDHLADGVVTDERGVVDGWRRVANARQRLGDVRGGCSAVPRDDRGHAHTDEVRRRRMIREVVRVSVDVDEAGRHHQIACVDRASAL